MLTQEDLLNCYVTPQLETYFLKKCPGLSIEELTLRLSELLKFLSLSHHAIVDIPVSSEIDELWHLWILETKQYHVLCEKLPSGKYLHHLSKDFPHEGQEMDALRRSNLQLSLLVSYVHNFGSFTEKSLPYWPIAYNMYRCMDQNLEALNTYLIDLKSQQKAA